MSDMRIWRGTLPGYLDPPFPPDQVGPAQTALRASLNSDFVNVTRFGAVGDGATDVTSNLLTVAASTRKGDVVYFPPGIYIVSSTVTWDPTVSVLGAGNSTIISYIGSGACFYSHGSNASFTPTFQTNGFFRDLVIDGSNAAGGAIGLDIGDGWGIDVSGLVVRHFNADATSRGLYLCNRVIWSEKDRFAASIMDCSKAVVMDTQGPGLPSHMYSVYDFMIYAEPGQNGLIIQGGAEPSRCSFRIRGNMKTNTTSTQCAAITIQGGASTTQCHWELGMECDGTDATAPLTFLTTSGSPFTNHEGILAFLNVSANTPWGAGSLGDLWNFRGIVVGDPVLSNPATPAVPASGTTYTNKANGAMVYVTGGAVTGISIDGEATGLTSGAFHVGVNDTIKLTYSAAPGWVWIWDTQ
jgi:hypothetical protein